MGSLQDTGKRSTMKFPLAFFALFFVYTCSGGLPAGGGNPFRPLSPFGVAIHIREGGVEYDQTEAYDPFTSDVISHVPGHIRDNITLHDVVKIENELLGLTVWKLKEEDFCHIENMEPGSDPTAMLLEAVPYEVKKKVVDAAALTKVYVHAKDVGEWNGDRESLTRIMKELCNGFPIRLVGNSKISKEGFDNLTDGKDRMAMRAHCCCSIRRTLRRSGSTDSVEGNIIHTIVVSD